MIRKATEKDFDIIAQIWEQSVRATHHFLSESYLQQIKNLLPDILPSVPVYVYSDETGIISGFLGVHDEKVEMLFIHPRAMGKGIGRKLMQYAVEQLQANKVDVNEDNAAAADFYRHIGFVTTGRSELDGMGKPFPLLHLELKRL